MEDLSKVGTMIYLAIYDKKYGKKDRKALSNYRHSYIYKKKLNIRIGILIGLGIVEAITFLYGMLLSETYFFSMLTKEFLIKEVIKIAVILIIYSVICTIKYGEEYDCAQERMEDYDEKYEELCNQHTSEEKMAL